jgi:ABC-2 type transport system ATP-binding protein
MPAVISVENLTKEYQDHFQAVRGISFFVEKGEAFGILGPNGAGKSTTLEIIEGLRAQTTGLVNVLGFDNRTHSKEIKKHIGVQLQSTEYLDRITLSELVKLFASFYNKRVNPMEVLAKVGLQKKHNNYVDHLSGGEQQRFSIALALVNDPEILFLDEPTTGLDPHARQDLWQLLEDLNSKGITLVLTTHYMEEAEYLCDRVAIIEEGKILAIGSPAELISRLSKDFTVSFHVRTAIADNFFEGIKGVHGMKTEYPRVEVRVSDAVYFSPLIEKLNSSGLEYSFLNIKAPGLEDVYIDLTGKKISN